MEYRKDYKGKKKGRELNTTIQYGIYRYLELYIPLELPYYFTHYGAVLCAILRICLHYDRGSDSLTRVEKGGIWNRELERGKQGTIKLFNIRI